MTVPSGWASMNDCRPDAALVAPVASIEPGTVTVRLVAGAANGRLPELAGGGVGVAAGAGVGVAAGAGVGVAAGAGVGVDAAVVKTSSPDATVCPEAVVDRTR